MQRDPRAHVEPVQRQGLSAVAGLLLEDVLCSRWMTTDQITARLAAVAPHVRPDRATVAEALNALHQRGRADVETDGERLLWRYAQGA